VGKFLVVIKIKLKDNANKKAAKVVIPWLR
jgi:hypothetical protein